MIITNWCKIIDGNFPHPLTDVLVKLKDGNYSVGYIEYLNRNTWYPSHSVEATYDMASTRFSSPVIEWTYLPEEVDDEDS